MDPVSFTASIIAILHLTSTTVGYLNDVKDAPKERARCSMEASNLLNLLNNLKYRLEEADIHQPWYIAVRELAVKGGPFDQYKSALEQLQPKVSSSGGISKIGSALLWKFSKQEVDVILRRMERLKTLVQIALEMDHFKLSQAIKIGVDTLHEDNKAIKDDTSAIRMAMPMLERGAGAVQQEQQRQRHLNVTNWISSIDYAAQQSDVINRRQGGTGIWFTNSPEFLSWRQSSNGTLFCPGIPGAGKTMIAAIAVDHLWNHMQNRDVGVAYIYCNYKTQADQKPADLAATILKQLIQERPSTIEPVASLYDCHIDRKTRPSLEEILRALQTVVSNYSKVYIVVDALDECLDHDGSRSQLLAILRNLQSKGNVSLMATSRFLPEVVQHFSHASILEVRARDSDVNNFVAGQIYRLPRCVQRDNELQQAIKDGISIAVDGMFLLARLHVDSLRDKNTKKKILSTLNGLPKGSEALSEAYKDAIERIEGQLPGNSMLAKSDTELDPANIPDVEDMVSVCAGLVTVDDERNIIRLVHYTTQEYFQRVRESWTPQAQQEIASACLTYLCFKTFRSGPSSSNEDLEIRIAENVFFEYAATNWAHHVRPTQEEVAPMALAFLEEETLVASTLQMTYFHGYASFGDSQSFPKQAIGLHLTAKYGLPFLSEELLYRVATGFVVEADARDQNGSTPLLWAAEKGQETVLKLPWGRGDVEADSKDNRGRTPLSYAAQVGHEAVVKILVTRDDVEADSKDNGGQTPLSHAAENGHEAVVKLLVARDDVEADSKDKDRQTPLSHAAWDGHEAVTKLLVARDDVDADFRGYHGRTPLSYAAQRGHNVMAELLVARDDVEVDSKDNGGQTPLSYAARGGQETMVKLLLARDDVEADSKDYRGRTPLSYAAQGGHEAVIKLLVARDDVETDSKDYRGRTPLSYAAQRGHEAMVELLVARNDVEADSKDDYGHTPLSYAAESGHEAVVQLLVARDDVEAHSEDKHGRTPLWWAAAFGHEGVVKLLRPYDSSIARHVLRRSSGVAVNAASASQEAIGLNITCFPTSLERSDLE